MKPGFIFSSNTRGISKYDYQITEIIVIATRAPASCRGFLFEIEVILQLMNQMFCYHPATSP
jgi:hypothetical protein